MAKEFLKRIEFPLGGVSKVSGFQNQQPYYTMSALNFWPIQWNTGRARGGTRPGIDSFATLGTPRNWCNVTWVSSGVTYRGVAVACAQGVYISTGGSFVEAITNSASSDFTTCVTFNNVLFQARFGETTLYRTLTTPGSSTGTVLNTTNSTSPIAGSDGGTPPADCGLVSVHMNRVVLAASQANPHVLYMSRAGYHLDWDYAQEDEGAAYTTAGGESGKIGEPITSLIPHNESCLIIGCTDSMYVIQGNPTAGGNVDVISHTIGPLMQSAWCKTSNGWTYFLSRDGLYRFPPGCPSTSPEQVSRKSLPQELVAIDPGTAGTYVSVEYDSRWMGLHIYVNTTAADSYYFYDLQGEGFWPMSFGSTMRLAVNHKISAEATESALLAITSGGTAYQFTTDSTESIASHCVYGPILMGPAGFEGICHEVYAVLAENSSTVSWKLYVADSAAEAAALVTADSASFTGISWAVDGARLLQYVQNPMLRGQCCYLKIYASSTSRISVEEIEMKFIESGARRVG